MESQIIEKIHPSENWEFFHGIWKSSSPGEFGDIFSGSTSLPIRRHLVRVRRVEVPEACGQPSTAAAAEQHQPHVLVKLLKVDHFEAKAMVVLILITWS